MLTAFRDARVDCLPGVRHRGNAVEQVVKAEDFDAAQKIISTWKGYAPTPLLSLSGLAQQLSIAAIDYKHEGGRFGLGSFKALGGAYATLRLLQREVSKTVGRDICVHDLERGEYADITAGITVVSATDGNHGRAVAWGAQRFGARCRIYIHAEVSENRADTIRDFGAEVVRVNGDYDLTVETARKDAEENGWFVVSDTSWPGYVDPPRDVMSGYGVMMREIFNDISEPPTHVFVQGGVGGLAAAVVASIGQHWGSEDIRMVIVEPELAPCLLVSARAGKAIPYAIAEETIMAGLSCGEPSMLAWDVLAERVDHFMTIPDSIVPDCMRLLAWPTHDDPAIEAGESAVAGLAGLICGVQQEALREALGLDSASRVLLIGSEGATDPDIYAEIVNGAAAVDAA